MENKRIIRVLIVVSGLFLALLSYLLYFQHFVADDIYTNPYNRRQWDDEKRVARGKIFDSNGELLAESVDDGEKVERVYHYGRMYSHVIGYCSPIYGKSMLEMEYDRELLARDDMNIFSGEKKKGFDLNLTIDTRVQEYAYNQMKGKRGAVVAMNPQTGEILAMVSLPDYDPKSSVLEAEWNNFVEDEENPLFNRVTKALYPPGSTFKIVTAAAAFENGMEGRVFEDTGKFEEGGLTVENYNGKAYGEVTVEDAFRVSSNQVFCEIGYELGSEKIKDSAERFGVGKKIDFDVPVEKSRIEYSRMTDADSALVAIGQGKLLTTPLHMLTVCSAIANDGKVMKPYLVKKITRGDQVVSKTHPQIMERPLSEECAEYIEKMMIEVVRAGTGTRAQIPGVTVAGKTGTAENGTENDHAWFVGYAPAEEPQIAIAVVLENDGTSGGDSAAPIAGRIMNKYLSLQEGATK